ncbi:hypothetical protein PVK06_013007 [Gossypium arboreum]|uniref:Uncharacterized protein n=1 Tax=Gossypium arboreum TaxID=29729 RepID=A0ABR0QDU0_GOSAR|nr:hypothetical protein PVK06_013007 [Gossypium arboreum]
MVKRALIESVQCFNRKTTTAIKLILLLDRHRFVDVDMRIRIKSKGYSSQIYAFYQKYVDEQSKKEINDILVRCNKTLLVVGLRRCESRKFGKRGVSVMGLKL